MDLRFNKNLATFQAFCLKLLSATALSKICVFTLKGNNNDNSFRSFFFYKQCLWNFVSSKLK